MWQVTVAVQPYCEMSQSANDALSTGMLLHDVTVNMSSRTQCWSFWSSSQPKGGQGASDVQQSAR